MHSIYQQHIRKRAFHKTMLTIAVSALTMSGCGMSENKPADVAQTGVTVWPVLELPVKRQPAMEQKIADMLAKMTVEQKVAQMIQPEIRDITVEDMRRYGFGSFLNGGGAFPNDNKHATPADWIKLAEDMYQASIDDSLDGSTIPTMWGTDAVHGHNNVIGATLFPHNIGLGAANNPKLIEQIAEVTAREVMVTGIDWVFAPTVAVVRDDRWGRTYEGYSEDPEIVRNYAAAIVRGLQGAADADFLGEQRVISTVKHFVGDGGTVGGDDQGDNLASEKELFDIHAQGYVGGLTAGAQTVMASFNSWHGSKLHGDKYLLTDVLKDRMGFDGFVVGDWNGHGQIPGCSNENCAQAANAGLDVYMVPTPAWKPLFENLVAQVKSGEISEQRINDAVTRILRVKMRAGLFDKPSPANRPLSGKTELIGSAEHRAVAREAVQQSLVLLKNNDNILPLSANQRILVTGPGADNIGMQSGGWTITWQGTGNTNADFPGGTSIYAGIKTAVEAGGGQTELSIDGSFKQKPDVAIVVFGEEPYAEGNGDLDNLEYQRGNKADLALLRKLKAQNIPVVSLFISGRPLWINPELNASDAFVAVWLPGSEGHGVADVILRQPDGAINKDFHGKLSFSWPATPYQTVNRFDDDYQPLLPYGFGLRYGNKGVLTDELPEAVAVNADLSALVLFELAVKSPWQMFIGNSDNVQPVVSSVQQAGSVSIRTFDRQVQEDARRIVFDGSGKGVVNLTSPFPNDLRSYEEAGSALTMTLQRNSEVPQSVSLALGCGDNCLTAIDIAPLLKNLPLNEWQQVSVDLQCFRQQGVELGQVFTPFSLQTSQPMTVSIAGLAIVPDSAAGATLRCQ